MARYVCDFNQITMIANKMISSASDLTKSTNSYLVEVERELSNWSGVSKNYFIEQTNKQAKYSLLKANSYNNMGEYLKNFIQKIEDLEESLSSNKI